MADPFLDITAFQIEYQGTLTDGEIATAARLLQVASDRVRDLAPTARETDAKQVVFEIVRDAANFGHLNPLGSYKNITGNREEVGVFDAEVKMVNDLLTKRHRVMLGIGATAAPRANFVRCDY